MIRLGLRHPRKKERNILQGGERSLVAAVLIALKGAYSQSSRRMGVTCTLVFFFHLRTSRINLTLPSRSQVCTKSLKRSRILLGSGFCTCHNLRFVDKKTADVDGLRYSPDDPYYRLGPVHTCLYVRACRLVTGTSS